MKTHLGVSFGENRESDPLTIKFLKTSLPATQHFFAQKTPIVPKITGSVSNRAGALFLFCWGRGTGVKRCGG